MSTATTTPTTDAIPYYVRALAMALPAVALGLQISGWIFFTASVRNGHADFRANYTAGLMVRMGDRHHIYDYDATKAVQDRVISRESLALPFIHPAYETIAYVPFSVLGFRAAYYSFLVVSLGLLFLSYRMLKPELESLKMVWKPLPIILCLTFLPVGAALMQCQDSILLLTLFVWAWALMSRDKDFLGGVVLGLGLFRFQFLVPIFLLFLLWRRWRITAGIALSAGISLLVSLAIVGLDGAHTYVDLLASMSVGGVSPLDRARYAQPLTLMCSLRALISGLTSTWLSPLWVQILVVFLSVVILLWAARAVRPEMTSHDRLLVALTTSAIVGYHMLIHDMAILLLPVGVCLGRSIAASSDLRMKSVLLGTTFVFAAPLLIAIPEIHFYWISLAVIGFLTAQLRAQDDRPGFQTKSA